MRRYSIESLSLDEIDDLNHFERDVIAFARELRDIGYDDAPEARMKLDALVALASEHRIRIDRRAERDADRFAREERETAIPAIGGGR